MDLFGYHIPSFAAVAAAWVAFYKAFARFDSDQSEANRHWVRDWILGVKVDEQKWPQFFKSLFAKLFGDQHLSLKCALRSCVLSIFIVCLIWIFLAAEGVVSLNNSGTRDFELAVFSGTFLTMALIACITDYLSLWKTRCILTRGGSFRNIWVIFLMLFVDAAATTALYAFIAIAFLTIYTTIIFMWFDLKAIAPFFMLYFLFQSVVQMVITGMFNVRQLGNIIELHSTLTAYYLAALLTSAWLWVYLTVACGARMLSLVPKGATLLSKFMDFDEHPVRTLGYVAATASAAFVLAGIVF